MFIGTVTREIFFCYPVDISTTAFKFLLPCCIRQYSTGVIALGTIATILYLELTSVRRDTMLL